MNIGHMSDIQRDIETEEFSAELYAENNAKKDAYDEAISYLEDIKANYAIVKDIMRDLGKYTMQGDYQKAIDDVATEIMELETERDGLYG